MLPTEDRVAAKEKKQSPVQGEAWPIKDNEDDCRASSISIRPAKAQS